MADELLAPDWRGITSLIDDQADYSALSAGDRTSTLVVQRERFMDQSSDAVPEQVRTFAPKPKSKSPRDQGADDERALVGMLQKAAGIARKKQKGVALSAAPRGDGASASSRAQPRGDDSIDQAGQALITMLREAAGISNQKCEHATILAGRLASELRMSENRIKQLEAEVAHFRDRAARAEKWLEQIAQEIDSRLISSHGAPSARGAGA